MPRKALLLLPLWIPALCLGQAAQPDESYENWSKMQEETISLSNLLSASISNGLHPFGTVDKLLLDENKQKLQYILVDSKSVAYGVGRGFEDGFVTFDQVDFRHDFFDTTIFVDEREAPPSAPEELELTRSEAEQRRVERILNEGIEFSDGVERELTDILIDRNSGELTYFVVSMEEESLFDTEQVLLPADSVSIDEEGQAVASMALAEARQMEQAYDLSQL